MSQDTTIVVYKIILSKLVKTQFTVEKYVLTITYQINPKICICEHKMLKEATFSLFKISGIRVNSYHRVDLKSLRVTRGS